MGTNSDSTIISQTEFTLRRHGDNHKYPHLVGRVYGMYLAYNEEGEENLGLGDFLDREEMGNLRDFLDASLKAEGK